MKKKLLILSIAIMALLVPTCEDSDKLITKTDNPETVIIGYGFNNYVAYITDKSTILELSNNVKHLTIFPTEEEIDAETRINITFYKDGQIVKVIYLDKNGIMRFNDKEGNFKADDSLNYDNLYEIYKFYMKSTLYQ